MKRIEALFITSVLFFLIAGLLYAWGPPAWFSRYPYSAGLRFLLALEAYFLCSSFFFALRSARLPRRGKHAYAASFIISFAAVPAFAALVLLDSPIQTVKAFVGVLDIAAWLSLALLAIARSERKRAAYYARLRGNRRLAHDPARSVDTRHCRALFASGSVRNYPIPVGARTRERKPRRGAA